MGVVHQPWRLHRDGSLQGVSITMGVAHQPSTGMGVCFGTPIGVVDLLGRLAENRGSARGAPLGVLHLLGAPIKIWGSLLRRAHEEGRGSCTGAPTRAEGLLGQILRDQGSVFPRHAHGGRGSAGARP